MSIITPKIPKVLHGVVYGESSVMSTLLNEVNKMTESEIQQLIQIEAAKHGSILLRNNSGAFRDVNGRTVRFGLGNDSPVRSKDFKSSDLIGITTVTVTEAMVGSRIGIFTACEVKRGDWKPSTTDAREGAQRNFVNWVRSRGGIALLTNSVAEFVAALKT